VYFFLSNGCGTSQGISFLTHSQGQLLANFSTLVWLTDVLVYLMLSKMTINNVSPPNRVLELCLLLPQTLFPRVFSFPSIQFLLEPSLTTKFFVVVLWPPSASPSLYPMPIYGEASNHRYSFKTNIERKERNYCTENETNYCMTRCAQWLLGLPCLYQCVE